MGLDETARRRKDFNPDRVHFVTLADGQPWGIIRPHWRWQPVFKDLKCVRVDKHFGYSRDVDDLAEMMADQDDDSVLISCVASIAGLLLKAYYDLTEAELDTLLCYRAADPDSTSWVRAVVDVITYQESTLPCQMN